MMDTTRIALASAVAITACWAPAYATSLISEAETGSEAHWHTCATIADSGQRLKCYDHLAGREESSPMTQSGTITSEAQKRSAPSVATRDTFGLTEKIATPTPQTVDAVVTAMRRSADNKIIVLLSNGQAWELLDGGDSRLDISAHVVIRRAAVGSFLMTLEGGRTHRVHRLS